MENIADQQKLHQALAHGHIATVKRLIREGRVPIQCKDPSSGWTTLFYAIRHQYHDLVRFLIIDQGHDDDHISRDNEHRTALMIAIAYDNAFAFNLYLEKYPKAASLADKHGETALMMASKRGFDDYIERLLDHGAEIDAADHLGNTALHYASAYGFNDSIQLLIERGCLFALPNKKGWTALDYSYSAPVAVHLQDCARIAYEGRKLMKKRMVRRAARRQANSIDEFSIG